MIVVADTSGIIAASDQNASESAKCQAVLREAGTVIISPFVLTEVDHLAKARCGSHARTVIIEFVGPSPAISGSSCYPTTYSQPVRREQRKS